MTVFNCKFNLLKKVSTQNIIELGRIIILSYRYSDFSTLKDAQQTPFPIC